MYLPAVPDMMRDFALDTSEIQLTMTLWFMGLASMPFIIGLIADRYGRRSILLMGGFIYVISTIVCAMTADFQILLAARFIEGGMVATMMVAGYAAIHESYEHKEAVRILALMGSIVVIAPALGPLLGGIILKFSHWRNIFWLIAIWSMCALMALMKWMPETFPIEARKNTNLKAQFSSYLRVIMNREYMSLMLVLGFIFCGFIVWITSGPLLVIESFHHTAIAFGFIQAIIFLAYIIGSHGVNFLLLKKEVKQVIQIGLHICLFGGIFVFLGSMLFPHTLYVFLTAILIYSFGSALCFAPLNRSIIDSSSEPMGVRVSVFTMFFTGFAALGSGIASLFFNGTLSSLSISICISVILACLVKRYWTR